jgi:predicted phage baseplate assembly protein
VSELLLDDCGCCEGTNVETPAAIGNPPGLDAIEYRAGTWASFRRSVAARLSSGELPALAGLRARDDDDFTLALIDGFAVMADVLTFYQERIANEAFLRTATERRSVLELAELLGYVPAPGVAADAWLAFTLQEAPGAPALAPLPVTIPVGTKTQSVPGPDEEAQTFETVGEIAARVEHNAMPVQTRARQEIAFGQRELYLEGTDHQLAPGDVIVIVGAERARYRAGENWDVRLLEAVEPDDRRGHTRIAWREGLGHIGPRVDPAAEQVEVHVFRRRAALFGHNAPDARLLSTSGTNLAAVANPTTGVWHNFAIQGQAIDLDQVYEKVVPGSWIALANATIRHRPESQLGYVELYRATSVAHRSRSAFGLSSRTTHVDLDVGEHLGWFDLRNTLVLAESERLPLAERPVLTPVYGDRLALGTLAESLAPGQPIAIAGARQHVRVRAGVTGLELELADGSRVAVAADDRLALLGAPTRTLPGGAQQTLDPDELLAAIDADDPAPLRWSLRDRDGRSGRLLAGADRFRLDPPADDDEVVAEIARVADAADGVTHDRDRTRLRLAAGLRNVLDRATVTINANVAPATHGESVNEILGSGDASRPDQRFPLKQGPLTFVRADTPSGRRSTLDVLVDQQRWSERPTLYGARPHDRAYVTSIDHEARATVVFGDGVEGARPPTGQQNVRAVYRKGLGAQGNVRADSLSTLLTRPLGVTEVTNPEPASGGQDPETLAAARQSAPRTVLTLDRAVSLRDHEDFARGFAGIAKALATSVETGPARGVVLTVAGPAGAAVEPSGTTHRGLSEALRSFGDPLLRTTILSYRPATFRLGASVKVAPDRIAGEVLEAVRAGLRSAFAFDSREFGQPVSIDEVVAVIHRTPGVEAVDVNVLRRSDQPASPPVRPRLFAAMPLVTEAAVTPAELLTLDPATLDIGLMP